MRKGYVDKIHRNVIDKLIGIRKSQRISHQTLADAAGISRSSISHIENGKTKPSLQSCLKIANALGVNLGDLINEAEE